MKCHADAADAVARRWVSVAGQLRVPLNCSAVYLERVLFDPAAAGSSLRLAFGSAIDSETSLTLQELLAGLYFSLFPLLFLDLCFGPRPTTLPFVIIFPFDLFLLRLSAFISH